MTGRDPIGTIRELGTRRERFYAAATIHHAGVGEVGGVVDAVEAQIPADGVDAGRGTRLLQATTAIGRIVLGEGIAADALAEELDAIAGQAGDPRQRARRLGCRRRAPGGRPPRTRAGTSRPSCCPRARRPSGCP